MTVILQDVVMETTVTTGTGAFTLAGAVTGYRTFGSVVADSNQAYYRAYAVNAQGTPTGDWEIGLGIYSSSGTTLSRSSILASSNSGAAVNFSAGTKRVNMVCPAQLIQFLVNIVAGDLIYGTGSDVLSRLPIGSPGQYLAVKDTVSGNAPQWDNALVDPGMCGHRPTLTSATPLMITDTTGGTLYLTPFQGNRISLYDGSNYWRPFILPEIALPLTLTADKNYDVFTFYTTATPSSTNTSTDIITFGSVQGWATGSLVKVRDTGGGLTSTTNYWWNAASSTTGSFHTTLADALAGTNKVNLTSGITVPVTGISMELSAAWTNDTTRADAVAQQDGVTVKSGATTRKAVATLRASASNTAKDSKQFRYIWPFYNRVLRVLSYLEATDSDNYTTDSWAQAFGSSDQVEVVSGIVGTAILLNLNSLSLNTNANIARKSAIGYDSTSTPYGLVTHVQPAANVAFSAGVVEAIEIDVVGRHKGTWLRRSDATGTSTWYGDAGAPGVNQSGLKGLWAC